MSLTLVQNDDAKTRGNNIGLDGELVALDPRGKSDFGLLQKLPLRRIQDPLLRLRYPSFHPLGRDVSGVVEKCGTQATQFRIGDEVLGVVGIGGGGYAAKAVLDQQSLALKPAKLGYADAAAVPLAGTTA